MRPARVHVDLEAVRSNAGVLERLAGDALLCAVVKADGYGHGAVRVARAALESGAQLLAVALVEEGAQLREAGITAPVLVLSEPPVDSLADAYSLGLTPTLYHLDAVQAAAEAARRRGGSSARWAVQLKVDTGMHRVGAPPEGLADLAARVFSADTLVLQGVFTHLATADESDPRHTTAQLDAFERTVLGLRNRGVDPGIIHAANSAAAITHPGSRLDMVRCGIALYGVEPAPGLGEGLGLVPAMSVLTEVTHTATVPAGEGVSYGLRHRFEVDTDVAVLPVGYADGVPRNLGLNGGEVLIGGVRRAVRGAVTMDQLVVEVGPTGDDSVVPVHRGDEAVLIGTQPDAHDGTMLEVSATEWAGLMDTIAYEVVCSFSERMPRDYR